MTWWLASLGASLAVVAIECVNRTSAASFWQALLRGNLVLIFAAQFCLWRSYSGAPHILAAWIAFSVGTSVARLGAARAVLHEPFDLGWAAGAAGLMMLAALCVKRAVGG